MNKKVLIIAEAGVNHNGDMLMAKKLIDVAEKSGADYVKFQSFTASKLVSPNAKKANYQKKNLKDIDDSQLSMLKNLELTHENHLELIKYCSSKKINFLSTAFDVDGLHYLNSLNIPLFKIPSGEITNYPYLKTLSSIGKPIILSTGMSTMDEIKNAIQILTSLNLTNDDITVLHCNTEYPTPFSDVNLHAMDYISNQLNIEVGYSDHTQGIEVPIAAVAMGAKVIEKHFTLSRNLAGPDHSASLEPNELIQMVKGIRNIEQAMNGDGIKSVSKSESKNLIIVRKSIHTNREIKKGQILNENDIIALRPGDGISAIEWNKIIGMKANKHLPAYHKLVKSDLK